MELSVSHIGICVADLDRSRRFYHEALGFEEQWSHRVGPEFGPLMEVDGVDLRSVMLSRDGVTIELLGFDAPGHSGSGRRRAMNELGFTHLSLKVDDVDEVARAIERCGGAVVAETRTRLPLGGVELDFLYCTDPDGVRIELMKLP
ncbi:MAG TPA: VOC family protein [Acidimicrobiales bacterium]|nr:VOC family protein [Acidimicrobiales bacterium]